MAEVKITSTQAPSEQRAEQPGQQIPDNSEMSLALGYNGIERLLSFSSPDATLPGGSIPHAQHGGQQSPTGGTNKLQTFTRNGNENTSGNGNNDAPGPLRSFTQSLGGQVSWLLMLAQSF